MADWLVWAIIGGAVILFAVVEACCKSKKPIKRSILTVALGIVSLFAVNLCSGFTGVALPVSTLSLSVSAIGGIPGVTMMLLFNMFL